MDHDRDDTEDNDENSSANGSADVDADDDVNVNGRPAANVYAHLKFYPTQNADANFWLRLRRLASQWCTAIASALLVIISLLIACAVVAHPCVVAYVHLRWPPPTSPSNRYRDDTYAALFVHSHGSALRTLGTHLGCHLDLAQRLRSTYAFPNGSRYADELTRVRDGLQWPHVSRLVREQADEALGLNGSLASLGSDIDRQTWLLQRDWKTSKAWGIAKQLAEADVAVLCQWGGSGSGSGSGSHNDRGGGSGGGDGGSRSGSMYSTGQAELGHVASMLCNHVIPSSLQTPSASRSLAATQRHQHPALFMPVCDTAKRTAVSLREYLAIILRIRSIATHSARDAAAAAGVGASAGTAVVPSDVAEPTSSPSSTLSSPPRPPPPRPPPPPPPVPLRTKLRHIVFNMSLDLLDLDGVANTGSFVGRIFPEHVFLRRKRKKASWNPLSTAALVQDAFVEFHTKGLIMGKLKLRAEHAGVSKEVVELWLDVRLLFGTIVSDIDQYDTHSLHLAHDILENVKEVQSAMLAYGCPASVVSAIWRERTRYLPELDSVAKLEHKIGQRPGGDQDGDEGGGSGGSGKRKRKKEVEEEEDDEKEDGEKEDEQDKIFRLRFTPNHLDMLQILRDVASSVVVTDPALLSPNQVAVHGLTGGKGKMKKDDDDDGSGIDGSGGNAAGCPRVKITEL